MQPTNLSPIVSLTAPFHSTTKPRVCYDLLLLEKAAEIRSFLDNSNWSKLSSARALPEFFIFFLGVVSTEDSAPMHVVRFSPLERMRLERQERNRFLAIPRMNVVRRRCAEKQIPISRQRNGEQPSKKWGEHPCHEIQMHKYT